jgi:hypothetical protein
VDRHFQASEAAWVGVVAPRVVAEKQHWMACLRYVEEMLVVPPQVMTLQRAIGMGATDGHQQEREVP